MRAIALATLALPAFLALAPPAAAQPALTRCRAIREDAPRLACFDRAAAALRFEEIMGPPMACRERISPAAVIKQLADEGFIVPRPYMAPDSLNFFEVRGPAEIGGLRVVAVFGYDEDNSAGFTRSPGTGPGMVLGFVTTASLYAVDGWRQRVNRNLSLDDYFARPDQGPRLEAAKNILCRPPTGR